MEGWNRQVYAFNAQADRYVLLPVVDAYKVTVPRILRERVSDFFDNLKTPIIFANEILQLKFADALATALRFGANTTFGMFGLVDVASAMGLPKYHADFGQTLGFWGVGAGGYLVLPHSWSLRLSRRGRDRRGRHRFGHAWTRWARCRSTTPVPAFFTANVIDARYQQPFRYFQTGSPFEYLLVRFAYTKKREIEIGRRHSVAAGDRASKSPMVATSSRNSRPRRWTAALRCRGGAALTDHRARDLQSRAPAGGAIGDERIGPAFLAEGRHRAVTRDEGHIVAEGQQSLADRSDEGFIVAARKIGSANRAGEQNIADQRQSRIGVKERSRDRGYVRDSG